MGWINTLRAPFIKEGDLPTPDTGALQDAEALSADHDIVERASNVLTLAMDSAAALAAKLDAFSENRQQYGDETLTRVLLLMVLKAYFIHLALLRLRASHTEENSELNAYAQAFETHLRQVYALEFKTTRQLIEHQGTASTAVHTDPLPQFQDCPMVAEYGGQTTADQQAIAMIAPVFYVKAAQQDVRDFLRERLPRFSVRFLSNM